jgi:DNA polymerase III subunit chi
VGAVFFYHLTRRPLEAVLPSLLQRSLAQGWRVVVRGRDTARLSWLDERLWLGAEDDFLPHGLSGGPHDVLQPILLTTDPGLSADCLICVDGAAPAATEVLAAERVCLIFDGNDASALDDARGHWKALTEAGCAAQYWSEASGSWEKKAETGA